MELEIDNVHLDRHGYEGKDGRLAVGIGPLLSAESSDDVDESPVVLDSSSRPSGLLLLLLLLLHLGRLTLDFAGTGERAVDFASEKTTRHLDGGQLR